MHPTYKALAKLGRAIKTTFLCRYLRLERFRREIHEGLNVVESWNSANGFVFFGKGGEIATNRVADQETSALALHLVPASLVYVNMCMVQSVLGDPVWAAKLSSNDLRGLSPLIYTHINPYGRFEVDLDRRIDFERKAADEHGYGKVHSRPLRSQVSVGHNSAPYSRLEPACCRFRASGY